MSEKQVAFAKGGIVKGNERFIIRMDQNVFDNERLRELVEQANYPAKRSDYELLKYTIDVSVGSKGMHYLIDRLGLKYNDNKIRQFEESKLALYTIYKNGLVSRTGIGELFKDLQSQINDHLIEQNK